MSSEQEELARRLAEKILDLVDAGDGLGGLSGTEQLTAAVAFRRPDLLPAHLGLADGPQRLDEAQKHAVRLIRGSRTRTGGRGRPRKYESAAERERHKAARRRAAAKADAEFAVLVRHLISDAEPRKAKKATLERLIIELQRALIARDEFEEFGG